MLLAMEKAATPSEGLEALATLQAMLVGDPAAQVCAVDYVLCAVSMYFSVFICVYCVLMC